MVTTATISTTPRSGRVTTCNGIFERTLSELMALRMRGLSYEQIATRYSVNRATVYRAVNGAWSDALVSAVTGEHWRTVPARVKLPGDYAPPDELVLELRRCDVSDEWFTPCCASQRFAPGLSEAVKRAARRDIDKARDKYARMGGDWGK